MTLGRFSLGTFIPGTRISNVHGTVHRVDPATGARDASALALYHPAAADRSPDVKRQSFVDIGHAPAALLDARARRAAAAPEAVPDATGPADDGASFDVDVVAVAVADSGSAAPDMTIF